MTNHSEQMPDLTQAKIYLLTNQSTGLQYIGSTTMTLNARFNAHKTQFNTGAGGCTSMILFESGDVTITLVEECPCDDKTYLTGRERYHIERLREAGDTCINKYLPGGDDSKSNAAWREANPDYFKDYREANRDKERARVKAWHDAQPVVVCPCGGRYKQNGNRHLKSKMHIKYLKEHESN